MVIDLSLENTRLYDGCEVEEVAGRRNLRTPPEEAAGMIGKNLAGILKTIPADKRDWVVLTGPMAVWAYLIVFHHVVHLFKEVRYADGRGTEIVISRHG